MLNRQKVYLVSQNNDLVNYDYLNQMYDLNVEMLIPNNDIYVDENYNNVYVAYQEDLEEAMRMYENNRHLNMIVYNPNVEDLNNYPDVIGALIVVDNEDYVNPRNQVVRLNDPNLKEAIQQYVYHCDM